MPGRQIGHVFEQRTVPGGIPATMSSECLWPRIKPDAGSFLAAFHIARNSLNDIDEMLEKIVFA